MKSIMSSFFIFLILVLSPCFFVYGDESATPGVSTFQLVDEISAEEISMFPPERDALEQELSKYTGPHQELLQQLNEARLDAVRPATFAKLGSVYLMSEPAIENATRSVSLIRHCLQFRNCTVFLHGISRADEEESRSLMYLLPDVTQPIGTLDFFAGLHNPFLAELLQLADTYFSGGMEEVPFQSSKDRIYVLSSSNSFFSKLYFDRVLKKQKESADKEKKSNPVLDLMLTMGAAPSPGSKEALESLKKKTIWMDMSAWVGLIRGLLEEMVVDLMPFVGDAFPVEALRMHLNRYNPDNHYQSLYQWLWQHHLNVRWTAHDMAYNVADRLGDFVAHSTEFKLGERFFFIFCSPEVEKKLRSILPSILRAKDLETRGLQLADSWEDLSSDEFDCRWLDDAEACFRAENPSSKEETNSAGARQGKAKGKAGAVSKKKGSKPKSMPRKGGASSKEL